MREIFLIAVGKLRNKELELIEQDYLKRIANPKLTIIETKSYSENCDAEANEVIKKIIEISGTSNYLLYTLEENGKEFSTISFSNWLAKNIEVENKKIFFVLGGASGHGRSVLERKDGHISLSKMTFPHKIARILLVEQIYRAQTIRQNHPYNK